jgi:hypothetical protein
MKSCIITLDCPTVGNQVAMLLNHFCDFEMEMFSTVQTLWFL